MSISVVNSYKLDLSLPYEIFSNNNLFMKHLSQLISVAKKLATSKGMNKIHSYHCVLEIFYDPLPKIKIGVLFLRMDGSH